MMVGEGPGRRLSRAGRVAVFATVVVYWGIAGFVGWSLAWSDDPGARVDAGPAPPAAPVFPNELQPLFDEPMGYGSGGSNGSMSYDVGDEGQVVVDLVHVDQGLSDTVPPRVLRLTDEQLHERDLAFAEGEDAYQRWETEVGLNRPYVELPRTPAIIDLQVGCFRFVVSGYDVPDPDPEGLETVEALLERRLEELHAGSGELCQDDGWYDGE